MAYSVIFAKRASKRLERMDNMAARRIIAAAEALGDNPRPRGARKIEGHDQWRIRVGDYRIIYEVHNYQLVVLVVKVGHRRDVYRGL